VSTPEVSANRDRVDTLSGLMSATAIFLAFLCATDLHLSIAGTDVQMRPVRIGVAAVVLALVAAGIGGRHRRLAAAATAIAGAGWLLGMVVAVITERPLF
jgi:putative Mn2+ efflux pump MntP